MSSEFKRRFVDEPPSMVVLRWITMPFVIVFIILATISGYRAIVQVYSVGVDVPKHPLGAGSVVSTNVASSGRVHVTLRLEMIQGVRVETLGTIVVRSNHTAS